MQPGGPRGQSRRQAFLLRRVEAPWESDPEVERTLKEDLELVTYNVSSENGSHLVEDFAPPGGPYLALGQEVDLEVVVRTFADNNQQACSRLRIARMVGEF